MLINITGGSDLTLFEVNEASSIIREAADEDANIIFGAVIDEAMRDEMKITVIATGFDKEMARAGTGAAASTGQPHAVSSPPLARPRQNDDHQPSRPLMNSSRVDDLDVPTFIRKKVD